MVFNGGTKREKRWRWSKHTLCHANAVLTYKITCILSQKLASILKQNTRILNIDINHLHVRLYQSPMLCCNKYCLL